MIFADPPARAASRRAPAVLLVLGSLGLPFLPALALEQEPEAPSRPPVVLDKPREKTKAPETPQKEDSPDPPQRKGIDVRGERNADHVDFPGRLEAAQMVELRPRVSGMLVRIAVESGSQVKKGDLLFEIDPRPYQAELDRADAEVRRAEARLKKCTAEYEKSVQLKNKGAIGEGELIRLEGDRDEAAASLLVARAAREESRLKLESTKVRAPIDGQLGRIALSVGNIALADKTALASIVSLDPMFVVFDVDQRTFLRLTRYQREGKVKLEGDGALPVLVGLVDEDGFPHRARLDGADSQVDPKYGTIRWRARFENIDRLFVPGMFVRVRLVTSVGSAR
jgi:RND family efflux transporter MFP subunit